MSEAKQTSIEQGDTLGPSLFAKGLNVVFSRELSAYFDSPIAYIYAAVFLVLSCTTFMNSFFLDAVVDMSAYFDVLPFLLIPFIPAITMRAWAEEHAQHTFEMLMTLPLHPAQIVLGKYAAALAFYAVVLVGSLPIVVMLLEAIIITSRPVIIKKATIKPETQGITVGIAARTPKTNKVNPELSLCFKMTFKPCLENAEAQYLG